MNKIATELIKGINDICSYVGEKRGDFHQLVDKEGLPAWRRHKDGTWRALASRLDAWLVKQADKFQKPI